MLIPAECAWHRAKAVSTSFCRRSVGETAISCANATRARFSAA